MLLGFLAVCGLVYFSCPPLVWFSVELHQSPDEIERMLGTTYGPIEYEMKGTAFEKKTFFGQWRLWIDYKDEEVFCYSVEMDIGWAPYNRRERVSGECAPD